MILARAAVVGAGKRGAPVAEHLLNGSLQQSAGEAAPVVVGANLQQLRGNLEDRTLARFRSGRAWGRGNVLLTHDMLLQQVITNRYALRSVAVCLVRHLSPARQHFYLPTRRRPRACLCLVVGLRVVRFQED